MTETWLPFAVRRDGPASKFGYWPILYRGLELIEGEVKHSAEGPKSAMYGVLDGPRRASWILSIYKAGPPEQHFPLEAVGWTNGSIDANMKFVGMEHEGKAGEPLNDNQVYWTTRISLALRVLCPKIASNPPARRVNLWEHNEMTLFGADWTACPSNRIPWAQVLAGLQTEEEDMARLVRKAGTSHVYVVTGAHLESVVSAERATALGYDLSKVEELPASDAIWKVRSVNDGGTATDD